MGIVDAMTSGLSQAARRPWLALIPFAVDLLIWLAPPLSVAGLVDRLMLIWEALVRTSYPPEQMATLNEMVDSVRTMATQLGSEVNLWHFLTGSWLSVPSALASPQSTRLTFISDMILAPVGLSLPVGRIASAPWQPAPIQVGSVWQVLLLLAGFWLVGQLAITLFMRWASGRPPDAKDDAEPQGPQQGPVGFFRLFGRLMALSLLLGLAMFMLRLPLGFLLTMILLTGSSAGTLFFAVIGGITLWVVLWSLTALYFAGDAIVLDNQPVLAALGRSVTLVRSQSLATIGVAAAINLLMLGFRVVWGMIGQNSIGAVLAMAGNAYLGTAMVLALFAYYSDRRRKWEELAAEADRRSALRNKMKD